MKGIVTYPGGLWKLSTSLMIFLRPEGCLKLPMSWIGNECGSCVILLQRSCSLPGYASLSGLSYTRSLAVERGVIGRFGRAFRIFCSRRAVLPHIKILLSGLRCLNKKSNFGQRPGQPAAAGWPGRCPKLLPTVAGGNCFSEATATPLCQDEAIAGWAVSASVGSVAASFQRTSCSRCIWRKRVMGLRVAYC